MNSSSGTLTISSKVSVGANNELVVSGPGNTTISGVIANGSGASAVTFNGTNKLTLSGANSFTGNVVVNSGTVSDTKSENSGTPAVGGLGNPQTAGRTVTINNGATFSVDASGAFGNGSTIEALAFIINQGGTMQVTTGNSTIGPVTLNGGTLNAYSGSGYSGYFGPFEFGGDVTVGGNSPSTISSGSQYNFNLVVDNAIANRTITVANVTGDANVTNVDLFVSAGLGDASGDGSPGLANMAGLIKAGTGTLLLSGTNLYSGGTIISAGTVIAGIADNLTAANSQGPGGTPTGGSTANPGGANSAGALGKPGSLVILGDTNTTLNGSSPTLLIGGAFTVNHPIIVSTNVTTGTYTIGGSTDNNSYFSNLVALNQPLTISQAANTGANALTFMGGIDSSNGLKAVTFAGPGNVIVTTIGGSGTLAVKVTGGALYLNAVNAYSGGTTITNGGILGGRGTISGAVTNQLGGILEPGAATNVAGTVLVISNLTLLSGSFTTMSVSHNGHTNDQIVSSNIVYGGTLTVTTNAGDAPLAYGDTFTLFKSVAYSGNFDVTSLPALGSGLAWGNTLSSDGKLTVVSANLRSGDRDEFTGFQCANHCGNLEWPGGFGWQRDSDGHLVLWSG